MVFAGISGTALSDTVALGGVEIPMMVNQGYDVPFSVAITAASSCLGPIIPPSVPMIMAATMTGLSAAGPRHVRYLLHPVGQAPLPQAR